VVTPSRRAALVLALAMLGAVASVFLFAYADLRREQARALEDFTSEQSALVRGAAELLRNELDAHRGLPALERLFDALRTASPDPTQVVWILLDDRRHASFFGREGTTDGAPPGVHHDEVDALLDAMIGARAGSAVLSRPAAEFLRLDRRVAVAAYAPIALREGNAGSVAVVASARRVRDRARLASWRLGVAVGMAALIVALFGAGLARHQRRAQRLAEQLALSEGMVRTEKLATIGTLAAGIAHEVGTPLGIISGRAEQLLARIPDGAEAEAARKPLQSILDQVDKVGKTIRQLLDFSRLRPIDAEQVTLAQALQNAAALLEHRFRQAKVALQIEASPTVAPVAADPGQLEQVLVNLLINACDACSAGGQVRVRAAEEGARVALEVRDDGVGIAPEHLPRVLDPFFTTKKRGQGTGLGLTIASDIVKNHGGSLELRSAVGEGTTIRVLLPRAAAQKGAEA
jgi:signal transduction histidine kinase